MAKKITDNPIPVKTIGPNVKAKLRSASGYADGVAGWGRTWQGFWSTSGSPLEDIDCNVRTIRNRARSIWYRSGLARNVIDIYSDWTLGSGLDLHSEASEGRAELEKLWEDWASSKDADSRGDSDFYSLSKQIFHSTLLDGDCFVILRRVPDSNGKLRLRLEAIEADLCESPGDSGNKTIVEGIELNRYGESQAYFFRNSEGKIKRVPKYSSDGMLQVIHVRRRERIGSVRGVSILAPILENILNLERYFASELNSALLESCFSVFVRSSEEDPEGLLDQGGQASGFNISLGSGNVNFLPSDAEISSIDGHRDRNASSLATFAETLLKTNICAGVGIPFEILQNNFSSSYSASRASCLLFSRRCEQIRDGFVLDFVTPVFEAWLEVQRLNDETIPEDANRALWTGPVPPSLDPSKTVAYLREAVEAGFMSRKQAAYELSRTDFSANARELREENALLAEANKPLKNEEG